MAVVRRRWHAPEGAIVEAWQVDFRDADGQRHRKQGFDTKREALAWEAAERSRVRDARHRASLSGVERRRHDAAKMTVADLGADWLAACKTGSHGREAIEPTTYRDYEGSLRLHIVPRIGTVTLPDVDGPRVAEFRASVQRELSGAKAIRVMRHLRQMLGHGVVLGWTAANPATDVRILRSERSHRNVRVPTDGQLQALIEATSRLQAVAERNAARCRLERPRDTVAGNRFDEVVRGWVTFRLLIRTQVLTGLRISEVRALRWHHLELGDQSWLRVEARASQLQTIGSPKSLASRRRVALPLVLAEELIARREAAAADDFVFPAPRSGLLNDSNVRTRFLRPAMKEAGLIGDDDVACFSFHGLRHYHASVLLEQKVSIHIVAARIGHADAAFTMSTYGHLLHDPLDQQHEVASEIAARLDMSINKSV